MPKRNSKGEQRPRGTRNVQRTMAILKAVAKYHEKGASLSKIARAIDLPIPTVKRILAVLVIEGIVSKSDGSKQYYLGYELFKMVEDAYPSQLQEKFRNTLENIANQTEDTVYLSIPSGLECVCIDIAEGALSVRIPFEIGSRFPLGLGTSGLTLLATKSDEKIETIIENNLARYAERGVKTQEIKKQILDFRTKGYTRYKSKLIAGIVGVGVPIFKENNEAVASIAVASTAQRMSVARSNKVQYIIKKECEKLSVGYSTISEFIRNPT